MFFQICDLKIFHVNIIFPSNCTILSISFLTRIAKLGKFETNKNMLVKEGGGHNPTIYVTFTFTK
jgi:hypothetical protein